MALICKPPELCYVPIIKVYMLLRSSMSGVHRHHVENSQDPTHELVSEPHYALWCCIISRADLQTPNGGSLPVDSQKYESSPPLLFQSFNHLSGLTTSLEDSRVKTAAEISVRSISGVLGKFPSRHHLH
nr:hypothetical protein Itr_chr06CG22810 [Ipomoea trifida]GLL31917.1 hypothetical protein Itr_chr07CG15200 [Ipomoea trifida]GLL37802.1 hypothetical protein Itr_chr10CG16590 [Ipomoea trifida]